MGAAAVLLLLPHVVLLPPEAPPDLAPIAETCVQAVVGSRDIEVTRLAPASPASPGLADRVRPDLAAAAEAYRQLSFREAKERAERAIEALQAEAATSEDFELLFTGRLRLALTLFAQHKAGPARQVLEAAARTRPDAQVTENDYPPNLVAAFEAARTAVRRRLAPPPSVTIQTSIAGVPPTASIDGRIFEGAPPSLPAGEHVIVAVAPGHHAVRQVVRLPASAPIAITLPAIESVAEGIVLSTALERAGARVRITMRRTGGDAEASREVDVATVAASARELAETLAGVARPVASAAGGQGIVTGGAGQNGGATGRAGSARTGGDGTGHSSPSDEGSSSVFAKWWFWTVVGGVVVLGFVGLAAANRRDPGTDVHVGVAP